MGNKRQYNDIYAAYDAAYLYKYKNKGQGNSNTVHQFSSREMVYMMQGEAF